MINIRHSRRLQSVAWRARRQRGQTLVLIAITLPVLLALILTAVEIGGRILQRREVEDALSQASRVAVQLFEYSAFAANHQSVRENEVISIGRAAFGQNLRNVGGLAPGHTPDTVADAVRWEVLPNGGTCTFGNSDPTDDLQFAFPAVCAVLEAPMAGMPFKGRWSPIVKAAATIDRIQ